MARSISYLPNRPSTNIDQINLYFDGKKCLMIILRTQKIHQNELVGQKLERLPLTIIYNHLDLSVSIDQDLAR